ncbi:uncharacterized protein LOC101240688 [Hydra vulgaris]|uniref:uncharacterized protein LOC101240688 n=1 Tax=Hydra vulgaris TaxID=6087 RepID=UPI0002B4B410|nr:uncharacterized protein LOC101240688 [Hydra vulgaris]
MSTLKQFARKCPTEPLTAEQHISLLICDAFVAGIYSPSIRQRLLEATEDNLEAPYKTALTMELATKDAFNLTLTTTANTTTFAASRNLTKSHCYWCGNDPHLKTKCPARNSTCKHCQRRSHWETVCLSKKQSKTYTKAAVVKEYQEENDNALVSTVIAAINSPDRLINVTINKNITQALIDTGSNKTFITSELLQH